MVVRVCARDVSPKLSFVFCCLVWSGCRFASAVAVRRVTGRGCARAACASGGVADVQVLRLLPRHASQPRRLLARYYWTCNQPACLCTHRLHFRPLSAVAVAASAAAAAVVAVVAAAVLQTLVVARPRSSVVPAPALATRSRTVEAPPLAGSRHHLSKLNEFRVQSRRPCVWRSELWHCYLGC